MNVSDLLNSGYDHGELLALLMEEFQCLWEDDDGWACYGRNEPALRLKMKNGKITCIKPGAELTPALLGKIVTNARNALQCPTGWSIRQEVLFCTRPIDGWYRYKNEMQVRPMPSGYPNTDAIWEPKPFLLEVRVPESSAWEITSYRAKRLMERYEWLLSLFLSWNVYSYRQDTYKSWVYCHPANPLLATLGYPPVRVPKFEDPSSMLPRLHSVAPTEYYTSHFGDYDKGTRIPGSLNQLLDKYSQLPDEWQGRFLTAGWWVWNGSSPQISPTIRCQCLIEAIEAMTPAESGAPNCSTCGKSLGKGPTGLFRDFIAEYVGNSSEVMSLSRKLYGLRSSITHGEFVFPSDIASCQQPGSESFSAEKKFDQAKLLVRIALVNWLLRFDRNREPPAAEASRRVRWWEVAIGKARGLPRRLLSAIARWLYR